MKNAFFIALIALTAASCKNGNDTDTAQNRSIDSLKTELMRKQIADSISQAMATQQNVIPVENNITVSTPAPASSAPRRRSTTTHTSTQSVASAPQAATTTNEQTTTTTTTKQKKGWSAKAKGAVIGAGVGAVTGAMIDKRKGEGAIVGGILGAGTGVGVGAIIDKKQKDKAKANGE